MHQIHPSIMSLSEQLQNSALVAAVCAWIAWLWTHEEIFADAQTWLKAKVKKHKPLMHQACKDHQWASMVKHWLIQKPCFGLTCQTCVVHYPALLFISLNHYRLQTTGLVGFIYAWMFIALTADSALWLLSIMRKSKEMEGTAERAMLAGATLLEKKAKAGDISNVSSNPPNSPIRTTTDRMEESAPQSGTGVYGNGSTFL